MNVRINQIFYLIAMTIVTCLSSCSNNDDIIANSKRLCLDVNMEGFSEVSSRAGGVFANSDKVYLNLDGTKCYATYNGSQWTLSDIPSSLKTSGTCVVYYVDEGLSATSAKALFSTSSGKYSNTTDKLTITATVAPATSRVHFKGVAGTQITIKGLKYVSEFNTATYATTTSTNTLSLTVAADGYTPYVYCTANTGPLEIKNGTYTYTRTFGSSVLQVGHSGYINIPTQLSHDGWTTDEVTNVNINGTEYGTDNDWNQKDPEPSQNVIVNGSDYSDDEDWNAVDTHEYVDLGLSVKWATCNVGATKPEEFGLYFAWGATTGYTSDTSDGHSFDWASAPFNGGDSSYNSSTWNAAKNTVVDVNNNLLLANDAAHVNWGGSWRMPTDAELTELQTNCTWTWTTQNNIDGYKVTGKNGNSIFLPTPGYRLHKSIYGAASYGYYWSGTLYTEEQKSAWGISFSSTVIERHYIDRYRGRSVRAVCP